MTDEQIKQNAGKYARLVLMPYQTLTDEYKGRYEGFIAGAHSRDGEVEMLQNQIEELSEQLKMNAENIQKLRNPWISVEERLPERENDKASWSNYVFIRTCFISHEEAKYDTINHIWYDKHKKILDDNRYVTHWMPIPELKKGE